MATLILNDIWAQFNRLIQSSTATDINRKINALNIAQQYLIERMFEKGRRIDEFLSDPTNVSNTIDTNYIACPSDMLSLHKAWYRAGTQHAPFGRYAFVTYDDLLLRAGQSFFDTTATGTASIFAVKEPYIYFDRHFDNVFTDDETITGETSGATATVDSVSGTTLTYSSLTGAFTNGETIEGTTSGTQATVSADADPTMTVTITGGTKEIKVSYIKYPDDMEYYDTLTIDNVSGTFEVGETISGDETNATATIRTVAATSLTITDRDGTFIDDEEITGETSSATADVNGDMTSLPQSLDWTTKYKFILTEAGALIWEHMKGANNVPARSDIVDGLIETLSVLNRGEQRTTWGVSS